MTALEPRHAYRMWAPTYSAETAISFLDEELAQSFTPPLAGLRLLDAGCGTGRRLKDCAAEFTIGVDASPEMIAAGGAANLAAADIRALPFASAMFDVIWCRLVLGHLRDPEPAYRELARVCRPGGDIFVTDFHADAVAAGHTRSFRDADGMVHEIEHHVHDGVSHIIMAERAGLVSLARCDGVVGPSVRPFYERAGRLDIYARDAGLAVVAAFLFRRTCAS